MPIPNGRMGAGGRVPGMTASSVRRMAARGKHRHSGRQFFGDNVVLGSKVVDGVDVADADTGAPSWLGKTSLMLMDCAWRLELWLRL
ncbi:hypothetical protein AB0O34_15615 [Sphaerisporangium sp. NPDC088356]|uniref:hypothetical protein n=1 Tax=Sphaerisporangium sp. NPDC088356 TaxID=3154871 RepID=UPI0034165318